MFPDDYFGDHFPSDYFADDDTTVVPAGPVMPPDWTKTQSTRIGVAA